MGAYERVNDGRRDGFAFFLRQAHQFPLAMLALIDMARPKTADPGLHVVRQGRIGLAHIDELRVAAALRQTYRMQRRCLGRFGIVGVVRMVTLARNVNGAVLEPVLVGDVVDHGTTRHLEARIMLWKYVPEQLHRLQKFRRAQFLIADDQDGVIDESPIHALADCIIDGPSQIDAADFSPRVRRERCDRTTGKLLVHVFLVRPHNGAGFYHPSGNTITCKQRSLEPQR